MDRYEITRILQSTKEGKTILIIAEPSYARGEDRERTFAAGRADSIEKPINPATFVDQGKIPVPDEGEK